MEAYPRAQHPFNCVCGTCLGVYERHRNCFPLGQKCQCPGCMARRPHFIEEVRPEEAVYASYKLESKVSTVNFCERCESMGKSSAMGNIVVQRFPGEQPIKYEICPGCVQDLVDWFSDITTTREKAYRKPWIPEHKIEDGEYMTKSEARKFVKELMAGDDE